VRKPDAILIVLETALILVVLYQNLSCVFCLFLRSKLFFIYSIYKMGEFLVNIRPKNLSGVVVLFYLL
jgi:hypothetical protein